MLFIGDVHGSFKTYKFILCNMQYKGGTKGVSSSLQLGDMGIGFPSGNDRYEKNGKTYAPELGQEHKFIRGNHDDPSLCRSHPSYAGDWKYYKHPDIFVVGGGFSVDYMWRTPDLTWWQDEELNNRQIGQMIRFYKKYKPRIVSSHECPTVVKRKVITNYDKLRKESRTEQALQRMFEIHKPEFWIFGHHHNRIDVQESGVNFVALNELIHTPKISDCIYEIPNLEWN